MPSNAYTKHLQILLKDAEEISVAHKQLRTGQRGRQWGLGALNRAVVALCVSSWEAYVEQLLIESVELLRPGAPPLNAWATLNASARSDVHRFNTPNAENTKKLFAENLGITDVTAAWCWQNCDCQKARALLNEALTNRHQVVHGVNPRPTVHNVYSQWLPGFCRNLGRSTDAAVKSHLGGSLGIMAPW
jgi:hypothetical protein